jgi:Ca2+:H+ antiporter
MSAVSSDRQWDCDTNHMLIIDGVGANNFFQPNQEFFGLTFLAIVPSLAEFFNAVRFAAEDNITLSLEIGLVSAVQVALIQMPVLVIMSAIWQGEDPATTFTLVFPLMDLICIIFAVIALNYISIDGRCNYFIGSALLIIYVIMVASFYFVP